MHGYQDSSSVNTRSREDCLPKRDGGRKTADKRKSMTDDIEAKNGVAYRNVKQPKQVGEKI